MLLYLVIHSRPNITNVVWELSKVMDGATPAALKELKRVIKFVLDNQMLGLKIKPKKIENMEQWEMVIYMDSDYAGCTDTCISISGYRIFLLGVQILWKSKAKKSITLSSAEAEIVACMEAVKDINFFSQIIGDM
jgi:hypothetical protein